MCRKSTIDLIDFDKSAQQKKTLEDLRQQLKKRRDELNEAISAVDAKLGSS